MSGIDPRKRRFLHDIPIQADLTPSEKGILNNGLASQKAFVRDRDPDTGVPTDEVLARPSPYTEIPVARRIAAAPASGQPSTRVPTGLGSNLGGGALIPRIAPGALAGPQIGGAGFTGARGGPAPWGGRDAIPAREDRVWSLIFTGNLLAQLILLVLVLMSVLSWTLIITKWLQLRSAATENRHFFSAYLRDQPLSNLYSLSQKLAGSPMARMFEVSYREIGAFRAQLEQGGASGGMRERLMANLSRSLERAYNQQNLRLESWLPALAIISSSAPYIGMFGTVLGIIDAFAGIGTTGVTSLAVVAPGISEALVATAAGLMAAIPALIAYNLYRNRLRELNTQMKNFALDVSNRLERLL